MIYVFRGKKLSPANFTNEPNSKTVNLLIRDDSCHSRANVFTQLSYR